MSIELSEKYIFKEIKYNVEVAEKMWCLIQDVYPILREMELYLRVINVI